MYCKTCGLEQSDVANYCTHDGSSTGSVESEVTLAPKDSKYCRTCGIESKGTATYCEKCGDSLLGIMKKEMKTRLPDESFQLHVSPSGSTLKKGLLGGGLAIACMFIAGGLVA